MQKTKVKYILYNEKTNEERKTKDMEEIDLKEIFKIFWERKIKIVIIIILFMIVGFIYATQFKTPMYKSSTTLVLASSEDAATKTNTTITATDITINSKLVATYSELIKSKNILREVIGNLGVQIEEEELRNSIEVTAVKSTELIEITVENESSVTASKIANDIARVFTEKVKEIYNINNVQIVDEAEISNEPSNINHIKDVALFFCIGLIIAFVYVIISNIFDTTIKSTEDIEKTFEVPVLASIPMIEKLENEGRNKRQ